MKTKRSNKGEVTASKLGTNGRLTGPSVPSQAHAVLNRAINAPAPDHTLIHQPTLPLTTTEDYLKSPTVTDSADMKGAPVDAFVVDMLFATAADSSEGDQRSSADFGGALMPAESYAYCRALRRAARRGKILVPVKYPLSQKDGESITHELQFMVTEIIRKEAKKNYAVYEMDVSLPGGQSSLTKNTLSFGRDHHERPTRHWVGLQVNQTSLLTGQNAWPIERLNSNDRVHRAIAFGCPLVAINSLCAAVDRKFEPQSILHPNNADKLVIQNIQFAYSVPLKRDIQSESRSLIAAMYEGWRFVGKSGGGSNGYKLGKHLRVACLTKMGEQDAMNSEVGTVLLRKKSGTHDVASVSIYDKAAKDCTRSKLSNAAGEWHQSHQRIDVTLQARGIDKLLNSVKKLARKNGVDEPWEFNDRRKPLRSAANVLMAIELLEKLKGSKVGASPNVALIDWLRQHILFGEFHLDELVQFKATRLEKLDRLFRKKGRADVRYADGYLAWKQQQEKQVDLATCLKQQGLARTSVGRIMRKVRRIGFSGKVPHQFWKDLQLVSLCWGATAAEAANFDPNNMPDNSFVLDCQKRMAVTKRALAVALCGSIDAAATPAAPILSNQKVSVGQGEAAVLKKPKAKPFQLPLPKGWQMSELDLSSITLRVPQPR